MNAVRFGILVIVVDDDIRLIDVALVIPQDDRGADHDYRIVRAPRHPHIGRSSRQ